MIWIGWALLSGCSAGSIRTDKQVTAVDLQIAQPGLVEVSAAALRATGVDWMQSDPQDLRLFFRGVQQPLWLDRSADPWQVMFYAPPAEHLYSPNLVYRLQLGGAPPLWVRQNLPAEASALLAADYPARLRLEENLHYFPKVEDGDRWLWQRMTAPQIFEIPFDLAGVQTGEAQLHLEVWGRSNEFLNTPDHHLRIAINGQNVADDSWDGSGRHQIRAAFPAEILLPGQNQVTVELVGDLPVAVDSVVIDWLEIKYPHEFSWDGGAFSWQNAEPGGLPFPAGKNGWALWDVTQPEEIAFWDQNLAGLPLFPDHTYLAVPAGGAQSPVEIRAVISAPDLRSITTGADYLVIGAPGLLDALRPLLDFRQSQGLKPMTVPVGAVFDQFGNGFPEPQAIRKFLKYAMEHWQLVPRFVLLVGDASFDVQGYQNDPALNLLPSAWVYTQYGGQTVSDIPIVRLDDDLLPDIAIGRLPARTSGQIDTAVTKILQYERALAQSAGHAPAAIAFADRTDSDFAQDAQNFLDLFPSGYQTSLIVPEGGGQQSAAGQTIQAWQSASPLWVAYFGHGAITQWGKDDLLQPANVPDLVNGQPAPIVVNMTCLTGLFSHPTVESLAESLLWQKDGGAVALLAPTSLTLPEDQTFLNHGLLDAWVQGKVSTLGEALLQAWQQVPLEKQSSRDVLETFLLLGDPALTLPPLGR